MSIRSTTTRKVQPNVGAMPTPAYTNRLAEMEHVAKSNPTEFLRIIESPVYQALINLAEYRVQEEMQDLMIPQDLETTNVIRGRLEAYKEQIKFLQKISVLLEKSKD